MRRRIAHLVSVLRDDRGVQLAELAIVLPIFLLLFGATAEFGRYFYEYSTLAKASRVGARYLSTASVNAADDTAAKNIVVYGNTAGTGTPILTGLTTANVQVVRQGGVPAVPETVTIQITDFKHQPIVDLGGLAKIPSLSLNIDVKPSVTMRYLITNPAI
ncbi:MAG TPA: TadE/TadG family type IV pilus assembly protein [Pyrinomonadaceae bacterium]|nr:TadE/TadG family type IV pilus assembly protein [Pyrinomonadaceae bacterium]